MNYLIGAFLSDLNMVEEGNADFLHRKDIINFEKMRRRAFVMVEMLQYQQTPYNFLPETKIQSFLSKIERIEDITIYKLSLECEPKLNYLAKQGSFRKQDSFLRLNITSKD